MTLIDNPFFPLSFIAGPAILTNACAVLQNGATMRYNLAITQWREFRASLAARLQLRGLDLLNAAVVLFAATTVPGLAGSYLVQLRYLPAAPLTAAMVVTGVAGLLFLLAATVTLFLESACGRALLRLQLRLDGSNGADIQRRSSSSDGV